MSQDLPHMYPQTRTAKLSLRVQPALTAAAPPWLSPNFSSRSGSCIIAQKLTSSFEGPGRAIQSPVIL